MELGSPSNSKRARSDVDNFDNPRCVRSLASIKPRRLSFQDHHITTTLNYDDGIGEMMCLTNAEDHNIPPITLNYDDDHAVYLNDENNDALIVCSTNEEENHIPNNYGSDIFSDSSDCELDHRQTRVSTEIDDDTLSSFPDCAFNDEDSYISTDTDVSSILDSSDYDSDDEGSQQPSGSGHYLNIGEPNCKCPDCGAIAYFKLQRFSVDSRPVEELCFG
ncbi:hypothetical protein P8452_20654 [Trifolium repens]|nr:hypothetical protein P8452_20654 [Trifolium repens]